ncbi:SsgA family sporulation/cell division regulator [Streptomyces mirabilis]|nr:SsgA family sporulation/cell division regulator [Streptomyces mirabilis]
MHGRARPRCCYIVLKPPDGMALLEVPAQDIERFLQETETLVPRGSESERIDSDVLLRPPPRRRLRSSCPESCSGRDCGRTHRCRPRPP